MKNKYINLKSTVATVFLATSLISSSIFASDIKGEIIDVEPTIYKDTTINGVPLDLSDLSSMNKRSKSSVSTKSAGTGVSYFEVYAVGSSNVGWELVSSNQSSTSYNHGGNQLRVAVLQIGLGNPNNATMGSVNTSNYASDYLCGSNLHICNSGEIVTGFLRYYSFDGQQSGYFSNSTNSVASPFGYWSDSISIQ